MLVMDEKAKQEAMMRKIESGEKLESPMRSQKSTVSFADVDDLPAL